MKDTSDGDCLHFRSVCPERYKKRCYQNTSSMTRAVAHKKIPQSNNMKNYNKFSKFSNETKIST